MSSSDAADDLLGPSDERYRDHPSQPASRTGSPLHALLQIDSNDQGTRSPPDRSRGAGAARFLHSLSDRIPKPIRRASVAVVQWTKGPDPPRQWHIKPIFPAIQTAPPRLVQRYFPKRKHKIVLLVGFYAVWILVFSLVLNKSAFSSEVAGYGAPVRLSCGSRYWGNKNACGVDGNNCRPFDNTTMPFRCPANCANQQVLNPHAVGDQEVVYRQLVIGGPTDTERSVESAFYRGDSFICGSAIHAGFLSNGEGGCGVLSLIGQKTDFPSVKQHGIHSVGFDSYFPLSFHFIPGTQAQCKDLRWPLLAVSIIFSTMLSLFTTSPAVFFWTIFTGLFFHVALVSDPPTFSDYYTLVSSAFGRFLPAAFVGYVLFRYCTQPQLAGLEAQIEKTILWLGACWAGALNNYTFDKLPIQRLTPHDLRQQPGAITALIIIVLVIFVIALGQAWAIRVEGKMPRYLAVYGLMVAGMLALVAVPNMNLRIHHYILALLLLPGTYTQTRPALLYQGLLVGLFVNGIARWGFDSILQTPGQLRGDAQLGSRLPVIEQPIFGRGNISFTWAGMADGYDGISVLVNDVERFRGYEDFGARRFTWEREVPGVAEYFRFAFMSGSSTGDYTKAGTWRADGSWKEMAEGASR